MLEALMLVSSLGRYSPPSWVYASSSPLSLSFSLTPPLTLSPLSLSPSLPPSLAAKDDNRYHCQQGQTKLKLRLKNVNFFYYRYIFLFFFFFFFLYIFVILHLFCFIFISFLSILNILCIIIGTKRGRVREPLRGEWAGGPEE